MQSIAFQWLEKEFLGYLDDWEKAVKERKGFTDEQKKRMILSQETLEGLRMTGNYKAIKYFQNSLFIFSVFIYRNG